MQVRVFLADRLGLLCLYPYGIYGRIYEESSQIIGMGDWFMAKYLIFGFWCSGVGILDSIFYWVGEVKGRLYK